jgi:hypothetical protein
MTKIETRRCPLTNVTCRGKTCALTSYVEVAKDGVVKKEWICDFGDRVVERE